MGLGNLSGGELLLLLVIALLAFGARRLPDATRAVGKGLREFKRSLKDEPPEQRNLQAPPPAGTSSPMQSGGEPKRLSQ